MASPGDARRARAPGGDVRAATADDLDALLALIADYQRFYAGAARDDDHNVRFFARFIAPSDLYVRPEARGTGAGEALVAAAVDVARERGASHVRWWTTLDNRRAQRLYERLGAERSAWFEYEIAVEVVDSTARAAG